MIHTPPPNLAAAVTVAPMVTSADAQAFKELNEQWIADLFMMEPADRLVLDDPKGEIVAKGGHVLIARAHGEVIGCVALRAAGKGVFELSKMAVMPSLRGGGVGRVIILAAIEFARRLNASSLFLGSSKKLANAVHLYEAVGFVHVPVERLGPMPYQRADVFMEYRLS